MNNYKNKTEIPPTNFTPIKKVDTQKKPKQLERKQYLDDLYSDKWLDKYFNSKDNSKTTS
jgi:hypothetical protein